MESTCLTGIWRIVSYERRAANGRVSRPFGASPQGYLIYTAEGLMSVAIMPKGERQPALRHDEIATPYSMSSWLSWRRLQRLARFLRAATHYISYNGRYTLAKNKIVNHVEVSNMPGLVGTDQVRTFLIRDNCLVLVAQMAGGSQCFTWERVSGDHPFDARPECD